MIGRLQRNKVRKLVEHVRLVHSVDSLRLAEEIQAQAARRDRHVEVLIEVNLGESQKGGIAPPAVRHLIDQMGSMLNIRVSGLMAMAPLTEVIASVALAPPPISTSNRTASFPSRGVAERFSVGAVFRAGVPPS